MSVLDMSDLLSDPDFVVPVTLRRVSATMSDGTERTTYSDSTIQACVQPATSYEVSLLPEGARLKNVLKVWSTTEVQCSAGAQDIIVYKGASYRAIKSEPWPDSNAHVTYCEGFVP